MNQLPGRKNAITDGNVPECARVAEQPATAENHQTQPDTQKDTCLGAPESLYFCHTLELPRALFEENGQSIFIEQTPIGRIARAINHHLIVVCILAQQQEADIIACQSLRPMPIEEYESIVFE